MLYCLIKSRLIPQENVLVTNTSLKEERRRKPVNFYTILLSSTSLLRHAYYTGKIGFKTKHIQSDTDTNAEKYT